MEHPTNGESHLFPQETLKMHQNSVSVEFHCEGSSESIILHMVIMNLSSTFCIIKHQYFYLLGQLHKPSDRGSSVYFYLNTQASFMHWCPFLSVTKVMLFGSVNFCFHDQFCRKTIANNALTIKIVLPNLAEIQLKRVTLSFSRALFHNTLIQLRFNPIYFMQN